MRAATLLLWLVVAASTAQAEVAITAPDKVDPYTLADVTFETDAKFVKVKISKSLYERVRAMRVVTDAGGPAYHYVFTGSPGKYLVEVTTFDPEKGIDDGFATVEVVGDLPGPDVPDPDKPDDPPGPGPVPVPNKWGVAELCQRQLPKLSASARAKAGQLAELYASTADRLNGDSQPIYPTIQAAWSDQQQRQTSMLGADKPEWMRVVLDPVGEVWNQHRGELDRNQVVEFWRSVASGLRSARPQRPATSRTSRGTTPPWMLAIAQ